MSHGSRVSPSPPLSTSTTTPDTSPEQISAVNNDIWGDEEEDGTTAVPGGEILSDLPTIRRQHMTDGYREGLSIGKARVMQQGFDQGYPIGIELGLRVGKILGVLEGYLACKSIGVGSGMQDLVQKMYDRARDELAITQLLKVVNEETLLPANDIPHAVLQTLEKWEDLVLESYQQQPQSGHKTHNESASEVSASVSGGEHPKGFSTENKNIPDQPSRGAPQAKTTSLVGKKEASW